MVTRVALLGLLCACAAVHAQAPPTPGLGCMPAVHTFCVTSTGDDAVDPAPGSGSGTLRQAIIDANAAGGANTIGFAIPNADPLHPAAQTISIARQLPAIDANGNLTGLLIDGFSQPGSALNTNAPDQGGLNARLMIEVVGSGGFYGFFYNCCGFSGTLTLTYQGLAMHGFAYMIAGQSYGLTPKARINVYGNYLGTGVAGTALPAGSNGFVAVLIGYDDAQIGGAQPWQRNLISGIASGQGISGGTTSDTVTIEGNLIGTDASGTTAVPNSTGILLGGDYAGMRVGCTSTGANPTCGTGASRNVISGNRTYGISIQDSYGQNTSGIRIAGNYIGSDWTGAKPLPNGNTDYAGGCPAYCAGIELESSLSTAVPAAVIGGFGEGEGNLIAWNHGPGILCADDRLGESFDNQANAIHNNAQADIAFAPGQGPIANDPGDADSGANDHQNHPVIQSASVSGTPGNLTLNVTYLVDSATGNSAYPLRIDFHAAVDEGSGEYLVSDTYSGASAGMTRAVSLPLPATVLELTGFVASATDSNGYSSQLSPSVVFDRIFANGYEAPH